MKYPSVLGGHLKKERGTKEGMCNVAGKLQQVIQRGVQL